jgi:hypothetical protein
MRHAEGGASMHPLGYHRRKRGGNRALHFSPLCRTRLGAAVEGRAGRPQHPEQVADERIRSPARRQSIRPRRALFDAAKPDLSTEIVHKEQSHPGEHTPPRERVVRPTTKREALQGEN